MVSFAMMAFKDMRNGLVQECLSLCLVCGLSMLAGFSFAGDLPILYAEDEIVAPTHTIPGEIGYSNYSGSIRVSESYLAIYEAWDPERESLEGRVRILDRVSLEEEAIVSLSVFQVEDGYGFQTELSDHQLAVTYHGGDTVAPKFGLFELGGNEVKRVVLRDINFESGYGLNVRSEGENWILWNSEWTYLLSGSDGAELGRWAVAFGERVGERWFLNNQQASDVAAELYLIDLEESEAVLDLKKIPELEGDVDSLAVEPFGDKLLLRKFEADEEGLSRSFLSIFDPQTDSVLWQEELMGYARSPVTSEGLWFGRTSEGDLEVRLLSDGVILGSLEKPEEVSSGLYGYATHVVGDAIYVSSGHDWFYYDRATFAFRGQVLTGEEPMAGALIQPIAGSPFLAWIYNDPRTYVISNNTDIWYPQVSLFDPTTNAFVGRIDPEDQIGISTSGIGSSFPSPEKFGIEFFAMSDGRIGMESRHLNGGGMKYQVFDPILRVETPRPELTASLRYEERPGFEVLLEKHSAGGAVEVLSSTSFGQGEGRVVDIAPLSRENGVRFLLKESEKVKVSTDYKTVMESFPDVTVSGESRSIFLAPDADAVVHAASSSGLAQKITYTVFNHDDGSVRFTIGPRVGRGGRVLVAEGEHLAVSEVGTRSVGPIAIFNLTTGEEKLSLPQSGSFALSGDFLVRYYRQEVIGHRISDDEEVFRIAVDYEPPFSSYRPAIHCGAGVVIFNHKVYDLRTGEFRFEMIYPDSEPDDYFGSHIVADGNLIAAVSTPQAKGYLFHAGTGEILRSFVIEELPEGFSNYASRFPRLAMDVERDVIAWAVNDSVPARAVNLFRVSTGERLGQIRGKQDEEGVVGGPVIRIDENISSGIMLHSSGLWLVKGFYPNAGLAVHDLAGFDERRLEVNETELPEQRYLKLHFRGRRGVNYQAFSGPLDGLRETGDLLSGTGGLQSVLLPVPPDEDRWFGTLMPEWAPAPSIFPF